MNRWIVAWVACVAFGGCKKKTPKLVEGDRCHSDSSCDDMPCIDSVCVPHERAAQARAEMEARLERARVLEAEANARTAEAVRKAAAEKELELLKESGVTPPPTIAEHTVLPPGPGVRVRVVTVTSKASAFAACRETERLTGGGCRSARGSTQGIVASHPSHHGEEDTVGARWNCVVDQDGADVTAFALCTKLP